MSRSFLIVDPSFLPLFFLIPFAENPRCSSSGDFHIHQSDSAKLMADDACFKAIPHNEASEFTEEFFLKTKFRKHRNTACIVGFLNCRIGEKDPVKAADELCGVA